MEKEVRGVEKEDRRLDQEERREEKLAGWREGMAPHVGAPLLLLYRHSPLLKTLFRILGQFESQHLKPQCFVWLLKCSSDASRLNFHFNLFH